MLIGIANDQRETVGPEIRTKRVILTVGSRLARIQQSDFVESLPGGFWYFKLFKSLLRVFIPRHFLLWLFYTMLMI